MLAVFLGISVVLIRMSLYREAEHAAKLKQYGLDVDLAEMSSSFFGFQCPRMIDISLDVDAFQGPVVDGRADLSSTGLLPSIAICQELMMLSVSDTDLDNATLKTIAANNPLVRVEISNTTVDDEGLAALRNCPDIRVVSLRESLATDAGISQLSGLTSLEVVNAGGNGITGAFLAEFAGHPRLHTLLIKSDVISVESLKRIKDTPVKSLEVTCKPSLLPLQEILESQVEELRIGWDAELDDEDRRIVRQFLTAPDPIDTLVVDPQHL